MHGRHERRWHKDWRTWAIVLLMLAGIGVYVLTLDDSFIPVGRSTPAGQTPR